MEAVRVEVLLAEHVVDVDPGSRDDQARAGAVRAGDAGADSARVDHHQVSGRAEAIARPGPCGRPQPRQRGVEALRREELGAEALPVEPLAELLPPRLVGRTHHPDQRLDPLLAAALEELQGVGDQDPARGGRRIGEDAAAAVGGADRPALDRAVGGHVGAREDAAAIADEVGDRAAELALVEGLGSLGRQHLQPARQVCEPEGLALAQDPALGRVDRPALGQPRVDRLEDAQHVGLLAVDRGALAGVTDRRADQGLHRHRPEALQRRGEAGRGPRDAAGGRADVEHLGRRFVEVDVDRHQLLAALKALPSGSLDEEVDQHRLLALVDDHEPARPQSGQGALDREGGEGGCDSRVDRVSSRPQDLGSRLRGQRMAGGDDALQACLPATGSTRGGTPEHRLRRALPAARPCGWDRPPWCGGSSARRCAGAARRGHRSGWRRR